MKRSEAGAYLKLLILEKEGEQQAEGVLLKEQFHQTYESLKPINLVKKTLNEMISSPDLKGNVVNAGLGYVSGIIAKKALMGSSSNPVTKLLGVMLEMFIANKVTKNAESIKAMGKKILTSIFEKKENSEG